MELKKYRLIVGRYVQYFSEYIMMLLIILECNSAFRAISVRPEKVYYTQLFIIAIGFVLLFALICKDIQSILVIYDSCVLLCFIFGVCIVFLLFNVLKTTAAVNYTIVFLIFLPLMIVLFRVYRSRGELFQLFYRLSDIIVVLSFISLIIWFLSSVMGVLDPSGQINLDWGGRHDADQYFYLRFSLPWQKEYISFLKMSIERNTGIFPESPMYNIFLNSALYTELFLKKEIKKIRVLILTLTIFSTFGTIGILICLLAYFLYLLYRLGNSKYSIFIKIAFSLILVIACILLIFNKRTNGFGSYSVHIDDYLASLKAWRIAPIFGSGYDNELLIQSFMSSFRSNNLGLSNSIAVVLAEGGLVLFIFYILPFLILFWNYTKKENRYLAYWSVGLFCIYFTTIFHYRFYMIMLLAFGYSFIEISRNINSE